jgi:hypothetical protein
MGKKTKTKDYAEHRLQRFGTEAKGKKKEFVHIHIHCDLTSEQTDSCFNLKPTATTGTPE